MAMEVVDSPAAGLGMQVPAAPVGLGRETYASFLLLAVAIFTLAGYVGLALFFVGVLR